MSLIQKRKNNYPSHRKHIIFTETHIKNMSLAQIGKKLSETHKKNISLAHKGKQLSEIHCKAISLAHIGNKVSEATKKNMSLAHKGEKNGSWMGGVTELHRRIRHSFESERWIKSIFIRDFYICQECFKKGKYIEAHHKKAFALILQKFLQEYSQFSPIDDKETLVRLSFTYKPFWDIDNGITLCKDCHDLTKKKGVLTVLERKDENGMPIL